MLTLVCAVVGVEGCLFTVEIKAGKLVGRLKKAIKHEMKNFLKNIDVYELELYLAKMGERETDSTSIDAGKLGISTAEVNEGVWLPDDDQAAQDLANGKVDSELIEAMTHKKNKMKESWSVGEWLEEMNMPAPHSKQIHVLVVISEVFSYAEVVRNVYFPRGVT
ncbi:hypothetical protein PR003_g5778 [Phytophthora rubi]|uniref:Crinkler effector protein N-terminal domain-containing protein n=1 Tax=Phytophthora rubi TaxID=129364 RepID=A0A6A4FIP1_9STRA|nr:hypothetical protein PR002_g5981 [Phytophthora rubi]KAE9349635.1 hypothetical protein PR003_g5778 [Phytophthora rubi]